MAIRFVFTGCDYTKKFAQQRNEDNLFQISVNVQAESLPEAPIGPGTETTQVLNSTVFDNRVCIYSVQIEIASILR